MTDLVTIIAGMPHGAAIIDMQGRVKAVNATLAEILGVDPEAFSALDYGGFFSVLLSDDSPWLPAETWSDSAAALRRGVPVTLATDPLRPARLRLVERGGELSVLVVTGGEDANFERYLWGADRFGLLIETLLRLSDAAVFVVDQNGGITHHNGPAIQLCQGEGEPFADGSPIIGFHIDRCVTVMQSERSLSLHQLVKRAQARSDDIRVSVDTHVTCADGSSREVEITVAPIDRRADGDAGAVVTVSDRTDGRAVRRDLQAMQHARSISRSAVGLAHELNNSATAMMSHLSRLAAMSSGESESAAEELRSVNASVRRIRRLGLRLERFAGTEPPSPSPEPGVVRAVSLDGSTLTETVLDTVSLAVSGTAVRTSFAVDSDLPSVMISSEHLSQALFNVLANAVEAMEEGGMIHIEVRERQDRSVVALAVRDEGHGMDPRIVGKVMQPYFTTKQHGIGMGLTVSYSLLKQVGGWIELDTEPGFGTTVRLFLPAVGPSQAGPIEDPDALRHRDSEYAGRFDGTRVLLVEDDPLVRRSLERTLQSVGCEVGAVGNGDRALELFRDERAAGRSFDVVVTDLTMPGRNDGVQLLRQVRELDPDIPAVLSSGALHRHNTSSYREAGFQFVLRKPFGEPEVRRALSVALAARAE